MRRQRSQVIVSSVSRGFILLEVMLAVCIFALVAIGLTVSLGDTADSMRVSNMESQIRLGLQSKLSEDLLLPLQLGVQADPPDSSGTAFEHEWKVVNLTTSDKVQLQNLYELDVRANWKEDGKDQTEEASIYVYHP